MSGAGEGTSPKGRNWGAGIEGFPCEKKGSDRRIFFYCKGRGNRLVETERS